MLLDNIKKAARMIAIEKAKSKHKGDLAPFEFKEKLEITVRKSGDKNGNSQRA